jgi:hypothetical protein
VGELGNARKILSKTFLGRDHVGGLGVGDNIKADPVETECKVRNWINRLR